MSGVDMNSGKTEYTSLDKEIEYNKILTHLALVVYD